MRDGRGNEVGLLGLKTADTIECSCDLRPYARESIVKQLAAIDLQSIAPQADKGVCHQESVQPDTLTPRQSLRLSGHPTKRITQKV